MKPRLIAMAAALVFTASLPAMARTPVPVIDPPPVSFVTQPPPDASAFKAILIKAAAASNWTVVGEKGDTYALELIVRNKHTATVDVKYTEKGFSVTYVSSTNLNYTDKGGARLIHPHYNTWVEALNRAIQLELSKAGTR